jgi:transposase
MGKHHYIELSQDEHAELEKVIRTGRQAARKQTRARILLLSDRSQGDKRTGQEVAEAALCSVSTVRRICGLYFDGGLALALNDKGWPGAKPKLTGELEAKLTVLACSQPPPGHARWTLRLLANEMVELGYVQDVSHVTVREWLKKTSLSLGA